MPERPLESLLQRVDALLRHEPLSDDLRRNLRALLEANLAKLDLVPRDEFDAQVAALHEAQRRLRTLEAEFERLSAELEARDAPDANPAD